MVNETVIPCYSVMMKSGNDFSAVGWFLLIEGDRAGKLVCAVTIFNPFGDVDIGVGKARAFSRYYFLCDVGI